MSTPTQVTEARLAFGRRLASLRQDAGFTKAQAAHRISYSRSAVARAEATGICDRSFCQLAGELYGAGDDLAGEHDRIQPLAMAARSQAAWQARQRRHPDPQLPAQPEQTDATFAALQAACPYCGKPVAVLAQQAIVLPPLGSPGPRP